MMVFYRSEVATTCDRRDPRFGGRGRNAYSFPSKQVQHQRNCSCIYDSRGQHLYLDHHHSHSWHRYGLQCVEDNSVQPKACTSYSICLGIFVHHYHSRMSSNKRSLCTLHPSFDHILQLMMHLNSVRIQSCADMVCKGLTWITYELSVF